MSFVIDRSGLKRTIARALRALQLMLLGAMLLALWLEWTQRRVENLSWSLMMACLIVGAVADAVAPRAGTSIKAPSPRVSGVNVIAVTGAFAAFAVAQGGMIGNPNPVAAAAIAIVTVVACIAMWRFATKHAGDIGEARFPTA